MTLASQPQHLESLQKMTRDLLDAAIMLEEHEARVLVDAYYQMQDGRIATGNQKRALIKADEPHATIGWLNAQLDLLEHEVEKALGRFARAHPVGEWAMSITGIGRVISAGLLAHIDITQAPTVGHIWAYGGLDPTKTWNKGEKRPWNASFKLLCWKIGDSFVKQSSRKSDVYGKVYLERKAYEEAKNERYEYADQAAAKLKRFNIGKDKKAYGFYKEGKLPPGHIHARCMRYATKLFLAHLHWVWFELHYDALPPKPYIIEHGGHTHFKRPPNW